MVEITAIKRELRIVGIDGFTLPEQAKSVVVGAVYRGKFWLDGIMRTVIDAESLNATKEVAHMITVSNHYKQLRVIMLHGLMFASPNIIKIDELYEETRLPVISVTEKRIDPSDILNASMRLKDHGIGVVAPEHALAGIPIATKPRAPPIFMQFTGLTKQKAEEVLRMSCARSRIPEPVRVAHTIASALKKQKLDLMLLPKFQDLESRI